LPYHLPDLATSSKFGYFSGLILSKKLLWLLYDHLGYFWANYGQQVWLLLRE
jgi:hypothetical protein